jgi:hypothetical protein
MVRKYSYESKGVRSCISTLLSMLKYKT